MTELNIPTIEENIPMPSSAREAFPELSPVEELEMRANVIKFLSDISDDVIEPTEEEYEEATKIAKEMAADPNYRPEFTKYPNETIAFLAGMVNQMNHTIVNDLSDLKQYVINKLITEIETTSDSKIRVAALKHLGDVDGVDAFKKRTEITVKMQSIEEVENELLKTLSNIESKVIDVEAKHVYIENNG